MKPEEYIERVTSKVTDEGLRSRLREELGEHWEDYSEHQPMQEMPQRVLGDETLLVRQTNAVGLPGMRREDVFMSFACALFTVFLFLLLRQLLTPYAYGIISSNMLPTLPRCIAVAFWIGSAWYGYLALHRHLFMRYGSSVRRAALLHAAFLVPWFFTIMAFAQNRAFSSTIVPGLILSGMFYLAEWMTTRKSDVTDRILTRLHVLAPFILAVFVATSLAIVAHDGSLAVAIPYAAIMFFVYVLWAVMTTYLSMLLSVLGIPAIFACWLTVALFLIMGVVPFLSRLVRRKPAPLVLRFVAGVFVPLAVLLPFIPQHVPDVDWHVPTVWTWDALEKKQLNLVYPWAAPLMRGKERVNVSYAAYPERRGVAVVQENGPTYLVTREDTTKIASARDPENLMKFAAGLSSKIAVGFTCDGHAIEVSTPGVRVSGYDQVFFPPCHTFAYRGVEIASVHQGSLMDLDISEDGLLAVSLSKGIFNATYVYVVDIAPLLAK